MKLVEGNTLPVLELTRKEVEEGIPLVDVIVALGFAKSKSEARRLIEQGAIKLSGVEKSVVRISLIKDHDTMDIPGPGAL